MTVVHRWQAFWFPPVPVRRLGPFRVLIAAYAFYDVAVSTRLTDSARADQMFYDPIAILEITHAPRLGADAAIALKVVLLLALAASMVGVLTRAALWVSAVLYTWLWAAAYSYLTISHNKIPIVIALFALAVAPAGASFSLDALRRRARLFRGATPVPGSSDEDPLAGWALRVVAVFLVAGYLFAAYAKLRITGPDWVIAQRLEVAVASRDNVFARALVEKPTLLKFLQGGTLLIESTAFLLLVSKGRLRDVWVASAALFHLGTLLVLGIDFTGWIVAYTSVYRLEVGTDRLLAAGRRVRHRLRLPGLRGASEAEP